MYLIRKKKNNLAVAMNSFLDQTNNGKHVAFICNHARSMNVCKTLANNYVSFLFLELCCHQEAQHRKR